MNLLNQSKRNVIVRVNETNLGVLPPGKSVLIHKNEEETTKLILSHEKESYKRSGKAYMNVESAYEIQVNWDTGKLVITHKEMLIESGIYYNCLFLSENSRTIEPVRYKVQGLDALKKSFSNQGIKDCLLDTLLELVFELLMAPIVTVIVAILIVLWLGWKWLLMILLGLYIFTLLGQMFGEWLVDKNYVKESKKQKIERFSQPEKIAEYAK